MAQIPKGRLVKGPYKPIWRDCAIYFSTTVCVSCPIGLSWGLVVPWHIAGILFVGVTVAHKLLVSRGDGNIRHRWHLGVGASTVSTQPNWHRFILQLVIPMFFFWKQILGKRPQGLEGKTFVSSRTWTWRPVTPAKTLEDDGVFPP